MEPIVQLVFGIIFVVLIIAIIYFVSKQGFTVYTSGSTQRYASEFTSTNQSPSIVNQLAFKEFGQGGEHFVNGANHESMNGTGGYAGPLNVFGGPESFRGEARAGPNRFAGAKGKIESNSPKSLKVERELFGKLMGDNHVLNL